MKELLRLAARAAFAVCVGLAAQVGSARAQALDPGVGQKVRAHLESLTAWAADPVVVQAVRDANAKGKPEMTNAQWEELSETQPAVAAVLGSATSKKLKQWEAGAGINKLFLRDKSANLVAASTKPLLFNVSARPPFKAAIDGKAWSDSKVQRDPTTQIKSVQIAVPVIDGGKVIGVLHSAVTVE